MDTYISENIKYIGVDDIDLDLFEGQYAVPEGVSYNSYVIIDRKIAVLDTVDARKTDQWLDNLTQAIGDRTPDYLVVSHMEPDHAANIRQLLELYPDCCPLCSAKAVEMMSRFFTPEIASRARVVTEGEIIDLGEHSLQFFMAPMVHWPEVMVSYERTEKILFSADGFGKFGALAADSDPLDWDCEGRRYYFNICGKYGAAVQALLRKAAALDIRMICPLHGPILRTNLDHYISLYDKWSRYEPEEPGIFIAYSSLHGNTARAAQLLAEKIASKSPDTKVTITDLGRNDMSEAVEDAFRYDRLVLASPTYDAGIMPVMHHFLHHLQSKAFQNRRYAVIENGSWAPVAGRQICAEVDKLKKMTFIPPLVTIESTLSPDTEAAIDTLADNLLA